MKSKKTIQKEVGFGHVYTLKEFIELHESGCIIPYDGVGYFHDGEKETDVSVWSVKLTIKLAKKYPYVCWYNK